MAARTPGQRGSPLMFFSGCWMARAGKVLGRKVGNKKGQKSGWSLGGGVDSK